jgi:hypothetical protein
VAVDYHGREQELLHDFVACSIILRHRRQQPMHDYRGTVYWCRARKKLGRNLVLYSDKGCVHLELRLLTAHAVRHAGISGVDDLLRLNPQHILKRYLKQSSCGLRHAHASIRHQAQKTAQRLRQKPDLDGFSRAYERNKPNWLQGLLHRLHYDRAQVIALTRPKMAKLKEEQTILDIIPIKLTPPMQWGYGGRDGLGERDQGGRGDHLGDIISIGAQGG